MTRASPAVIATWPTRQLDLFEQFHRPAEVVRCPSCPANEREPTPKTRKAAASAPSKPRTKRHPKRDR